MTLDFLEQQKANTPNPFPDLMVEEVKLLRAIARSVARPTIPCTLNLKFMNPNTGGLLTVGGSICEIRFGYQQKPVKSTYLIIGNNTVNSLQFTLNEPIVKNAALTRSNGIGLATNTNIIIAAEIEFVQISVNDAGAISTQINNSGNGVPSDGTITVYAFTSPFADMFETQ